LTDSRERRCRVLLSIETYTYRRVKNIRISAHFTHLRKFRNLVFATKVTIFSDYNPLIYLRECAQKSAKLTRWAPGLQEFMHADSNILSHVCTDLYSAKNRENESEALRISPASAGAQQQMRVASC